MALSATDPSLTAHGDQLNVADGFIAKLEIGRRIALVPAVPSTKESKGHDERAAYSILMVGGCNTVFVDTETGFVSMCEALKHTELLCAADAPSLKKAVAAWAKRPTSASISSTLLRRDRGTSQFTRVEDGDTEVFMHPTQLLANIDVGASTRTWLISTAGFVMSYHQIFRAYLKNPRDFSDIDRHIEALKARIAVLGSEEGIHRLSSSALASATHPYAEHNYNYTSMAHDALDRLAMLSRCDLEVFKYIKKLQEGAGSDPKKSKKSETGEVSAEQLRFLRDVATANGDLWFRTSAHTYEFEDRVGAVIIFPSGYPISILGAPGVVGSKLMKDRSALARIESILPYLPYELSGYSGSVAALALHEAQIRKGDAKTKVSAKVDLDTAKTVISGFALRLATSMITDPLLFSLTAARIPAEEKKVKQPSQVALPPEPAESSSSEAEAETEEIIEEGE